MQKAYPGFVFGHKSFINELIFKIFATLFKTFGILKGGSDIFFLEVGQKMAILKKALLKDGV